MSSVSEEVSSIKALVEACLRKLLKNYEKEEHKEAFLTESDVASSLFCMLKGEMEKRNIGEFAVHSGLRPYIEEKGLNLVIKAKDSLLGEWKKHEPKNSGSVVDIVLINRKPEYFEKAKDVSPKKYWRLVTYPLEAFKVCIEVKIRVPGNIKRIKKDIIKLRKIRETNRSCLVYLVVVDRKASNRSKENIKKYCDENGVPLYIAFPPLKA
ncbi:MAG: hypothetical protein OEW62_10780 [Candidatus Bathyarchaeota archaeon]|nr:hypothetical protein [Candidatus Bathyarchaeota archaeon]